MTGESESLALGRVEARVEEILRRMEAHDKEHEIGAARASAAETQLWNGLEVLRVQHDGMNTRLATIDATLKYAGNPVLAAERLTALEGSAHGVRWVLGGFGAALLALYASTSGWVGSIMQALGGGPPKQSGG